MMQRLHNMLHRQQLQTHCQLHFLFLPQISTRKSNFIEDYEKRIMHCMRYVLHNYNKCTLYVLYMYMYIMYMYISQNTLTDSAHLICSSANPVVSLAALFNLSCVCPILWVSSSFSDTLLSKEAWRRSI